jgi:hypothetical protein
VARISLNVAWAMYKTPYGANTAAARGLAYSGVKSPGTCLAITVTLPYPSSSSLSAVVSPMTPALQPSRQSAMLQAVLKLNTRYSPMFQSVFLPYNHDPRSVFHDPLFSADKGFVYPPHLLNLPKLSSGNFFSDGPKEWRRCLLLAYHSVPARLSPRQTRCDALIEWWDHMNGHCDEAGLPCVQLYNSR